MSVIRETKNVVNIVQPVSLLSIFPQLSSWVPGSTWSAPQVSTEDTLYGNLKGMETKGSLTKESESIGRNFENQDFMKNLGFVEDINFAADGPGASNWGYSKTENGKMQVAIFGYSSNHLLGPESTAAPFVNLSVFVSDPFVKK